MQDEIFRAYDIRGNYPTDLNEADFQQIAAAVGTHLNRGVVVIGHDGRLSSPQLYRAVQSGLSGVRKKREVVDAGLITTPMLSFLVHTLHAAGGMMVTASHNPKHSNGLKVVRRHAAPVSGTQIQRWVRASLPRTI